MLSNSSVQVLSFEGEGIFALDGIIAEFIKKLHELDRFSTIEEIFEEEVYEEIFEDEDNSLAFENLFNQLISLAILQNSRDK